MELLENRRKRFLRSLGLLLPPLFLVAVCCLFLAGVSRASADSLEKEQQTLLSALENGAVRTYALTGAYPESLSELMADYHITYDHEKFVVDYVPNGANLLPSISVLPIGGSSKTLTGSSGKGGGS